jgi:hypothetical protein
MCHLSYSGYQISIWRDPQTRQFCFQAGNKEKNVIRKNIPELVFARTRSVRALAKIMGISFNDLIARIKESSGTTKQGN